MSSGLCQCSFQDHSFSPQPEDMDNPVVLMCLRDRTSVILSGEKTATKNPIIIYRSPLSLPKIYTATNLTDKYSGTDQRCVWQGLQTIAEYKSHPSPLRDASMLNLRIQTRLLQRSS